MHFISWDNQLLDENSNETINNKNKYAEQEIPCRQERRGDMDSRDILLTINKGLIRRGEARYCKCQIKFH